ncbi:PASTA domain-containing protein [Streptomyces shenzhenensis]|uniref:PASTA domain-containing protein n=1 Tax=Streptomyces shenzhenensis TaxID=943815 RepID=UPI00340C89F9
MRIHMISAVLLCAAAIGVTACEPVDDSKGGESNATTVEPGTATSSPEKEAEATSKPVRNFVGMGLQSAQDAAQEDGFYSLKSHDALGRERMQAFDRNWQVCSQNVAAGKTVPTDTTLDFGAVKLDESCPAKDETAPSAKGGKMPDFKGKSVKAARAALDASTSFTVKDASPDDRWVLVESNWEVCTQSPATGTDLNGQPVSVTAVKFGETCP